MGTEEQIIEPLEGSTRLTGESLEEHCRLQEEELQTLRESESRHKLQYEESQRRERILIRKLALKEQEIQDYVAQIAELKTAQLPTVASLRSTLLDPAVNIIIQKLKSELQATKARLEETQNELSAWKFTPDSNTGKRLMAKCRLLYQENEELGKMTSNGRLAKLEGDLALQKSFSEEVKKSQSELDDFLQELDEDVEGMQSTILFLQQELKTSKDTISGLERENNLLKNGQTILPANTHLNPVSTSSTIPTLTTSLSSSVTKLSSNVSPSSSSCDAAKEGDISILLNGTTNCSVVLSDKDVRLNSERILRKDKSNSKKNDQRTLRSSTRNMTGNNAGTIIAGSGGDDVRTTKPRVTTEKCNGNTDNSDTNTNGNVKINFESTAANCNDKKRAYNDDDEDDDDNDEENDNDSDESSASSQSSGGSSNKIVRNKKVRRSSVLSIDLNEEDSQIEIDDERTILPTNGSSNGGSGTSVGGGNKTRVVSSSGNAND